MSYEIMEDTHGIRNMFLIAHLDHAKSNMTDYFIAKATIITKLLYLVLYIAK